ncbi:hypothetical protein XYCOK13_24790 [Xylanibacillus composti]|uniref:Zinc ribbon domain-containing protein n=1 Tax=Xylanibacillus composti TaxID=1572762 RepID=A0A8J4H4T4_9BACL|nr:zinc ribbon domain-containing protein [Xylanibacillus composti]GIQ69655.1 hypothetical protein XYCOK13_24790 [Xylanibacillus composti]
MKSIKPGRGPSAMGAVGSIAVGIFGVIWTFAAASMGAPIFFVLFGIVFVGVAVVQAIYHYKNATGRNRMSLFDITSQEPDPLDTYFNGDANANADSNSQKQVAGDEVNFCPYCGKNVADESYKYCPGCGKAIR